MKQNDLLGFCRGNEVKKTEQISALSSRTDRYIDCDFNSHSVPRLYISLCFFIGIKQFVRDKRATAIRFRMFHKFFLCVALLQMSIKSVQINAHTSRSKVKEWLAKYPRSPWWIHNARLADFCGIQHHGDLHNTVILGKYMPRGENFWDKSPGLH